MKNLPNSGCYGWFAVFLGATALAGCVRTSEYNQHDIVARIKPIVEINNWQFKDLNSNGKLDPYEDWRLPTAQRVADLLSQMTLREKAGLMLIDTLNSGCDGQLQENAKQYIQEQQMRRFIFRNTVTSDPKCGSDRGFFAGSSVTPRQTAHYFNLIQELAESSRLGIPVIEKSNPRNHYDQNAKVGISAAAGAFTAFPKEPGLAAAALGEEHIKPGSGMAIIKSFADIMGTEWHSLGLRGMYGYMADLGTEPRWHRFGETFTENADLNAGIMKTLVEGLQKGPVGPSSNVAMTLKHFPGGGPQEMGLDPHYSFGKYQVYPAHDFAYHLKPFKAAIDAGVSSIMPYYGVPVDLTYQGVHYDEVGFSYSKKVVTDLLRDKLGFKGYVNTDTGILDTRAWGLENKTVSERIATSINAGVDIISGFHNTDMITSLVKQNLVSESRIDESAKRLLSNLFNLGLFENPYVDEGMAASEVGGSLHQAKALELMRKSIVLLQNKTLNNRKVLPMGKGDTVYVMGMAPSDVTSYGYQVVNGEPKDDQGKPLPRPSAKGSDYAIIRVNVTNQGSLLYDYRSRDPKTGVNPNYLNPLTHKTWGSEDPCNMYPDVNKMCVDDMFGLGLIFGGPVPWEINDLSFTRMAHSHTWHISPSLETIQAVMKEVGSKHTILSIYFRNPYVLDKASGLTNAGAILATFGVSDQALMSVLSGQFSPQGRMPFALPKSIEAVIDNDPDAPGYPMKDTLFPYNFGLTY